jgi:pyruvate kinase
MITTETQPSPPTNDNASTRGAQPWDNDICLSLIGQLWALRKSMLEHESALAPELTRVLPEYRESARNLIHFLSLRSVDLRPLQEQLAWLGLSSLGRAESHVLANLDKVLGILHRLTHQPWEDRSAQEPVGSVSSRQRLKQHAMALLGEAAPGRSVRIMVTLPSEAAADFSVVRDLVDAGMDIARINCAHDAADDWRAMAGNVRRAAKAAQRKVKILMDLGGPKIRTGVVAAGPPVLKLKLGRDDLGHVLRPARLGLRAINSQETLAGADACVGVWDAWLERLKPGNRIDFVDARGAKRHLLVVHANGKNAMAECMHTAYLTPETVFHMAHTTGRKKYATLVCQIASSPGIVHLSRGDHLRLTKEGVGDAATLDEQPHDGVLEAAHISCTLPQVVDQVRVGERIWFDDGRIGGVIRQTSSDALEIEITHARQGGEKLGGDKGINLPDSQLDLPALTEKDINDLSVMAAEADMVGLSFVQKPGDVRQLHEHLRRLGREDMGVVLKIETRQGFENLPALILAAMATRGAGIMIARGDLAVECGYERLAEVQEEILWCAEAAHMPVIWATQVLETLAKTGLPSRAEVSDAALGERAECVMLNKGPYITDAIRTLDNILKRMEGHQAKKRPLLRALRAWGHDGTSAIWPTAQTSPNGRTA